MTGNIFRGYQQNALFVLTGRDRPVDPSARDADGGLHTPFLQDRWLAVDQARTIRTNARHLSEEIQFAPTGRIVRRARAVLAEAEAILERVASGGLFAALAQGVFADTRRTIDGGRGYEGVVERDAAYANPFLEAFRQLPAAAPAGARA